MPDSLFQIAFIGPGGPEFLLVMLVLLIMFGAKDAPRILRKLNEIINQIRNTADGFKREVMYGDLSNDVPSYEDDDSAEYGDFTEDDDAAENDHFAEDDGSEGDSQDEPVLEPEDSLDEEGDAEKT
jgi:Sec-independent protein translocase protein TatA